MSDRPGQPADPLLLLPLRLEYRVIEEGERLTLGAIRADARRDAARPRSSGPATVSALGERSPLRLRTSTTDRREIWFRWLPDEPFSHEGVEPATAEERAALAAFLGALDPGADWFDVSDPTVAAAWQAYAAAVGVYRGIHLARTAGAVADEDLAGAAGRIVGLPQRISLFGLTGTSSTLLGRGRPIQDELRYSPAALGAGDWLTSYPDAIRAGMGVKVTDPTLVGAALDADWVIAVGIRAGEATEVAESYLRDAIANGNAELLEQDTPTNNSENARTRYDPVPRDPVAAVARATYAERRSASDPTTDAHALATALGVGAGTVLQAPGAGIDGVGEARAMATALLPGLVDILFSWLSEARLARDDLIDFLTEHAASRGPLPAVRLDTHPFGVLPIVDPGRVDAPDEMSEAHRRVFEFVHTLSSACVGALQEAASQQPVIEPGAADGSERLARILRLNAVGKRVDVLDAGDEDPRRRGISCPLVEGPEHGPGDYIGSIQTMPLADLPDPDQTDTSAPLLFRLLRLTLERTAARLPASLRDLPLARMVEAAPAATKHRLRALVAALDQLKGLPRDQLEVLMLEVVDLLHHRHDAWLTAIATSRLAAQRRERPVGLQLGYYGLLGRLRPASATGASDGYIQTPNVEKALTAGLLRSAGRRYGEASAFNLDLSSRRVRRALAMIDLLREGLGPREVLGHRAERWLHDQGDDALIHELRARYPLPQGEGSTVHQERLMDGLALAEGADADLAGLSSSQIATAGRLRSQLADDLDAMSDLTVAEAVHQMAMGNDGAANAWINVLSGEPVPSSTAFVSTHRDGHGSTHRYSLVLDPRAMSGDNPRELVEPAVGRLAARLIGDFTSCAVRVSVAARDGDARPFVRDMRLRADLGMTPVDLVVGGRNEIVMRARHHLVRLWRTRADVQAALGVLPATDLITHINQVQPVSVDLAHGTPTAEDLLAIAQGIGRMIRDGRALEATDLNAAAPPDQRLGEAEIVQALAWTISSLTGRAEKLSGGLAALLPVLNDALDEVRLAAAELERLRDAAAPQAQIEATRQQLADAREGLEDPLLRASRFALPEALVPFATGQLETGGAANEQIRRLESISRRLAEKRAGLDAAAALATTAPAARREAEQLKARLTSALQAACDGEGLPILPPFRKQPKTAPPLEALPDVGAEVRPHERIRPKLRAIRWLVDRDPDQRAWRSTEAATADADADDPDDTVRSERERPRSRHFGIYLGLRDGILGTGSNTAYSGIVFDEWSEFRPSMVQNTGMAINYDAPQSEPPHVLLLGVAPHSGHTEWSSESAAALVQEAVRLMQTRALPSTSASRREYVGALFNVVPPSSSGRRRIPAVNYRLIATVDDLANRLELIDSVPSASRTVHAVVERRPGDRGAGRP